MAERLPVVPTSRAQRWLIFRRQGLPLVMFFGCVLIAAVVWRGWVAPPTFIAEAEAVHTEVRSTKEGLLANMQVELMQTVRAGDVIGHVIVADPRQLEGALGAIRAQIEYLRASMEPVLAQQRAAFDYEKQQLDWMRQRVELTVARGRLVLAEADLLRTQELHARHLVTAQQFEIAKNTRDALAAQVEQLQELVQRLEVALGRTTPPSSSGAEAALRAAIQVQEETLRATEAELSPIVLKAPASGVVSFLFRRAGEGVARGEPIVRISPTDYDRIIGFVRQPLSFDPKPGMQVELRTRTFTRRRAMATITQVGVAMEPITPSLLAAMRLPLEPAEFGLRIHVSKAAGLGLRPGETVDAIIRSQ